MLAMTHAYEVVSVDGCQRVLRAAGRLTVGVALVSYVARRHRRRLVADLAILLRTARAVLRDRERTKQSRVVRERGKSRMGKDRWCCSTSSPHLR